MQVRRRALTACCVAALILAVPTVRAASWDDVGGYLQSACTTAGGSGTSLFGGDSNLRWVCTISQMYGFVNNTLINGDWQGFAKDIVGRYGTDLAHYLTGKLGFGSVNATLDKLNDAMRGSYTDFRNFLMNGMRTAIAAQRNAADDNAGLPASTPGGLADYYANTNPMFSAAQAAGRAAQTVDAFRAADQAFQAKSIQQQSDKAIESVVKPAITNAASVIGAGAAATGTADQIQQQAETALSTREVVVAQTRAMTEMMKQNAVYSTSQINLMSEIARQSVMSNQQLMAAKAAADQAAQESQNQLKTYLEGYAEDALNQARDAVQSMHENTITSANLLDPRVASASDLGGFAP